MSNYALEINGLTKEYADFKLDSVSFTLEKGTVMGLIGQNGAGKTTIIKLIMNAIGRNSGEIKVFDMDNIADEVAVKEKIGYIADADYLFGNSNLKYYARAFSQAYKSWDQNLFEKYAKMWELSPKKKFAEYSKGMKTKAMFALTLAHKPELLILDEPTAGLDPVARIEVLDILREIVQDGDKAVIFSTHITGDLDKIADYITLLINGKVTESMAIDKIEDKYLVIMGDNSQLEGKENRTIGFRKGSMTFEALIKRDELASFGEVGSHTPNIENLLTFSIWGNRGKETGDDNDQ